MNDWYLGMARLHQADLMSEAKRERLVRAARANRTTPGRRARLTAMPTRLGVAILTVVRRRDHALTDYPCRLADGSIGRVAVVQQGGEWTLVCRVA